MNKTAPPLSAEQKNAILWRWRTATSVIGVLIAITSCIYAYNYHDDRLGAAIIGGILTFSPPAWLMFEYCILFPSYGDPKDKDDLKYGQGLATKFWGGVAVLLAVIYELGR